MSRGSESGGFDEGGEDTGFSVSSFVDGMDNDNGLIDELHALAYGEVPRGLGWAWNAAESTQLSTVLINGVPHTFNPLTRELTKQ